MTEEAAFLAAIKAAKAGHDLPRLVFADWLEERGDPRAAWVRDAELWEWMKPDAADPADRIIAALSDPERRPHLHSCGRLLARIGPAAVPAVRRWFREAPAERWWHSQEVLETHAPPTLDPVPELIERVNSGRWYEVWVAVIDLGHHGPAAAEAVPTLMNVSYDEEEWERIFGDNTRQHPVWNSVNKSLGKVGPVAMAAVPQLASEGWYRWSAYEALLNIKPDPLLVLEHTNDDNEGDTKEGLRIVAELDPTKTRALAHAVRHQSGRKRYFAAELLGDMGPEAADAVPDLLEVLRSNQEWDREEARRYVLAALEKITGSSRAGEEAGPA